jgi:hypothetical protein
MRRYVFHILLSSILFAGATASDKPRPDDNPSSPQEIIVLLKVKDLGSREQTAFLVDKELYLPMRDLFSFLRIRLDASDGSFMLNGFFIKEENLYRIDLKQGVVTMGNRRYQFSTKDFLVVNDEAFVRTEVLSKAFGLFCSFDFRELCVTLTTQQPLPVFRDKQRLGIRQQPYAADEDAPPGQTIPFRKHWLSGWALDWSLSTSASKLGVYNSYSFGLGAELLGGDVDAFGSGTDRWGIHWEQLQWRWRYAFPTSRILTQLMVGNIMTDGGSATGGLSLEGVQVTNSLPYARKSFGKYVVSDHLGPDWDVEMYVNNQLIDFTKTDEGGNYRFEIPLLYGSTPITMKYYGPWGEERALERLVQIPFTFLPAGEVEYSFSAGRIRDYKREEFGQVATRWGLSSFVTVGAGAQYLHLPGEPVLPLILSSVRFSDYLLLNVDHTQNTSTRGTINLQFPSQLGIELSYSRFAENSFFNRSKQQSQSRLSLSMPFRSTSIAGSARLSIRELAYASGRFIHSEVGLSLSTASIQSSVTIRGGLNRDLGFRDPLYLQTSLSMTLNVLNGTRLRLQGDFDHLRNMIVRSQTMLERNIWRTGWVSLNIERNNLWNTNSFSLNFRFEFSAFHVSSYTQYVGSTFQYNQYLHGSMTFDPAGILIPSSRNSVRQGGINVQAFLDVNNNGIKDFDEQVINDFGATLHNTNTYQTSTPKGLRFEGLEPYNKYLLNIDTYSLENPLWIPKYTSYDFTVSPNQYKTLYLPVIVSGEVSGKVVKLLPFRSPEAVRDMRILIKREGGGFETETFSLPNGEYSIVGLPPGKYMAYLDAAQLAFYHLKARPEKETFWVLATRNGDIVEQINFVLEPSEAFQEITHNSGPSSIQTAKKKSSVPQKQGQ